MEGQTLDNIQNYADTAKTAIEVGRSLDVRNVIKQLLPNKSVAPEDNKDMLKEVLNESALDTFRSIELTVEAAAHILLDETFSVESVLDPTWQKRWLSGAGNVAANDEERRTWWARLLAGEIQKPGTYSLRALSVMDCLSPREAQFFKHLCSYVWTDHSGISDLVMPTERSRVWTPDLREMELLDESGLVSYVGPFPLTSQLRKGQLVRYGNSAIDLVLNPTYDASLRKGPVALTSAGREIMTLVEIVPDLVYVDEIMEEWKSHSSVHYAILDPSGGAWRAGAEVEGSLQSRQ